MDRNVLGTIGVAIPEVELAIRDPESGAFLPPGEVGEICSRGPHIMRGYHKDDELTRSVIDADGWFATGDLGFLTEEGDLCFRGRLKETIVLKGGENVEPAAVEDAILPSPLIEQAIVVGQDRKALAVLIVPDREVLQKRLGIDPEVPLTDLGGRDDVLNLLRRVCVTRTSTLKPQERVTRVAVLPEAPDPSNGLLTQTLKVRRHLVAERFADQIEEAYDR
jgi:long-chain acyl-CoA synthetase